MCCQAINWQKQKQNKLNEQAVESQTNKYFLSFFKERNPTQRKKQSLIGSQLKHKHSVIILALEFLIKKKSIVLIYFSGLKSG